MLSIRQNASEKNKRLERRNGDNQLKKNMKPSIENLPKKRNVEDDFRELTCDSEARMKLKLENSFFFMSFAIGRVLSIVVQSLWAWTWASFGFCYIHPNGFLSTPQPFFYLSF